MCLLVLLKGKFLCLFLVLVLCRVLVLWPCTSLGPCTLAGYFGRGRDLGGLLRARAGGERLLAGAAFFRWVRANRNQADTACAKQQARLLRLLHTDSKRSSARRACGRGGWPAVGGCSWNVAPRARADRERPLAGAVSFRWTARADHNQRGTACASSKLECCASLQPTSNAEAHSRVRRDSRPRFVEAVAGTSHHGAHAEGEMPLASAAPSYLA